MTARKTTTEQRQRAVTQARQLHRELRAAKQHLSALESAARDYAIEKQQILGQLQIARDTLARERAARATRERELVDHTNRMRSHYETWKQERDNALKTYQAALIALGKDPLKLIAGKAKQEKDQNSDHSSDV